MTSLTNLELIFSRYSEQHPSLTNPNTYTAAEHFFANASATEIFDHFSLEQIELDILAVISLNLRNLDLFEACIQQGAKIINHSRAPALSFLPGLHQFYQRFTFENEQCLEVYLHCKGPFLSPIYDSGEAKPLSWIASSVFSNYAAFNDEHLIEKTILRELAESVDLHEKKQKAIQLFPKFKSILLANCSPEFLTQLSEDIELPQFCLQYLSQQLFTNRNIKQDLYLKRYADYKEKILILQEDLERNHPDSNKGPALITLAQYDTPEVNKKAQHFNFDLKPLLDLDENKTSPNLVSFFQTPNEYCSFFYLMHFENLVQLVERLSETEKEQLNPEHPLHELGVELVNHLCVCPTIEYQSRLMLSPTSENDYAFSLLALVHTGVWHSYLNSPLFNESSAIALLKRIHHLDSTQSQYFTGYHYHSEDLNSLSQSFCQRLKQLTTAELKTCLTASLTPDQMQSSALFSPLYAKILNEQITPVQDSFVVPKTPSNLYRF